MDAGLAEWKTLKTLNKQLMNLWFMKIVNFMDHIKVRSALVGNSNVEVG